MQKLSLFFNSLWKRKKLLIFAFLFFVVAGIFMPSMHPIQAACGDAPLGDIPACIQLISGPVSNVWAWFRFTSWNNFVVTPIVGVADFFNLIFYYIATGVGYLFIEVMIWVLGNGNAITRMTVFLSAWNVIKAWAIMLIDLSLIAVALMLILRLWVDKAKQLLPRIIIVALLINFSGVLVGLFYDISNLIMTGLLANTNGRQGADLVLKVNDAWNAIIWPFDVRAAQGFSNVMLYFTLNLLFDAMYFILALALLYFCFIMVERYVILAMLFVVSPLAFAFWIVPVDAGQKLFAEWWEHFLKYCFLGVGAAFFLRLAIQILESYPWEHVAAGDYAALMPMIIHFSIVIFTLVFGLILAKKGSQRAVDYTMKGAGITWKVVGGVTGVKGVTERTSNAVLDKIKYNSFVNYFRDWYGGAGASALAQKKEVGARLEANEATERIGALSLKEREGIAFGSAYTEQQRVDRTAARKAMFEDGTINNHPDKKREIAEDLISQGVSSSLVTKGQPDLIDLNKGAIARQKARIASTVKLGDKDKDGNTIKTETQRQAYIDSEAKRAAKREEYANMKVENLENTSDEDIVKEVKQAISALNKGEEITGRQAQFLQQAVKNKILEECGTFDEVGKLLKHAKDDLGSSALKNAKDQDPLYAEHDIQEVTKARDRYLKDLGTDFATQKALADGGDKDAIAKIKLAERALTDSLFAGSDIVRDLSKTALKRGELIINLKQKGLWRKLETMTSARLDAIKKATANPAERAKIFKEIGRLFGTGNAKDTDRANELADIVAEIDLS